MKKNLIKKILFWIIFLSTFGISSPTSVPLSDPVYPFLERMETLGFVAHVHDGIKPFSRQQVSRYLKQIAVHRSELTHIDRRRLEDFLLDYRWEIDPTKRSPLMAKDKNWYSVLASAENFKKDFRRFFRQNHPEEENHVFFWETDSNNFYFDYEQGLTYERRSDDIHRMASWQNYIFRGVIDRNFAYRAKVSLQGLRGNEEYVQQHPLLKGSWSEKNETGPRYADRTGGELAWHNRYFNLRLAQQEIEWGYGESGKLILSNNPEQYPYLSISKDWGWGKFIALHGKLQSFPQDTLLDGQKLYPDKWLAAHRLEVTLWQRLTLGFNENFIYGNRYADWSYLLPFNFYRAVQHKLRDRDNATISLDAEYLAGHGIKLYGTIFLDEFKASKIGTNWYGNKQAFQAGAVWYDPFQFSNLSLRVEYTAIMPWVYTHKYRINSYTSDYRSLGHWAGPNSQVWYFHVKKDWHQRLTTGIVFQQWKHGANYPDQNIGGDILLGHSTLLPGQTAPKETRRFLEGILTTRERLWMYVRYEVFNDFFITTEYRRLTENTEGTAEIFTECFLGLRLKY